MTSSTWEFIENSTHWHQGVDKGNQLSRRWVPSQWTSITAPDQILTWPLNYTAFWGYINYPESETMWGVVRQGQGQGTWKEHTKFTMIICYNRPSASQMKREILSFWNLHEKPNIIGNMMTNELSYWYFATNENTSAENWDQRAKDVLCTRNT